MFRKTLQLISLALCAAGCTTATETFPGQSADHVWSALVAVAEAPSYEHPDPRERWTVRENGVWVDEDENRIEIYRRLVRRTQQPLSQPRREDRTWRIRVTMEERGEAPRATFTCRDLAVPAHVWAEADRYFDDVWDLLGGRPEDLDVQDELDALGLDDTASVPER